RPWRYSTQPSALSMPSRNVGLPIARPPCSSRIESPCEIVGGCTFPAPSPRLPRTGCKTRPMADFEVVRSPWEPAMRAALDEARAARDHDDVPVGAVVVCTDAVIAARHNERELTGDPTAHAEVLALRDAAAVVGHWRLHDVPLGVTRLEVAMGGRRAR